ncbi:MAG: IPT/TIG domain-containing protein [Spirochaetaceae bacterium]|nr:IPT/TIG domain-containing protein [Spirochaetaceae bacterium]
MNRKRRTIVVAALSLALLFLAHAAIWQYRVPVITSIEPPGFQEGVPVRIRGRNFGNEKEGGMLLLDGVPALRSACLEWSDECITLAAPMLYDSCLVRVKTSHGTSNSEIIINEKTLPVPQDGGDVQALGQ